MSRILALMRVLVRDQVTRHAVERRLGIPRRATLTSPCGQGT